MKKFFAFFSFFLCLFFSCRTTSYQNPLINQDFFLVGNVNSKPIIKINTDDSIDISAISNETKIEVSIEPIEPINDKQAEKNAKNNENEAINAPGAVKSLGFRIEKIPSIIKSLNNTIKPIYKNANNTIKAKRDIKRSIKFLFVPTHSSDYNPSLLFSSVCDYSSIYDYDLIIFTGTINKLYEHIYSNDFFHSKYKLAPLSSNILICHKESNYKQTGNFIDFGDYLLCCFSVMEQNITKELLETKPVLFFASPKEASNHDKGGENLNFTKEVEELGFIDLFDASRFSSKSVGLLKSGYTYEDDNIKERIDFVYGKSLISSFVERVYLKGLSDNKPVCFGLKGEVFI